MREKHRDGVKKVWKFGAGAAVVLAAAFWVGAGIWGGSPDGAGDGTASGGKPVMLRLAEAMPPEHPSARAAALFSQLGEERSDGRIRIRVYNNSELGMPGEVLEQMEFGGIAAARVSALNLTDLSPRIRDAFTPGAFSTPQEQMEWVEAEREALDQECYDNNLVPLVWYYPDYRCFYSSRTDIADSGSLEGLKVQTASCKLMTNLMAEWGAESVGLTSLDPFKFFNSGNIDGAESAFGEFVCCGYADYSRYVTINHSLFFPDVILINKEVLESLSREDQELIQVCAQATYAYQKSQMEELYDSWQAELTKKDSISLKEGDFR